MTAMDWLSKPRAGVEFVPVIEADEIVEGRAFPPLPQNYRGRRCCVSSVDADLWS